MTLYETLQGSPVIAAVRDPARLESALRAPVRMVFLLYGDMFSLPGAVQRVQQSGRLAFVHLDLVEGISRDAAGVRWIARTIRPQGVLSTRAPLLKVAAEEGLHTVLRMFMIDSSSLETGERMVKSCAPDLVEVMPGLVTRAIKLLGLRIDPPVIAGGMMELARDVEAAFAAGAVAVSTSQEALWRKEGWQHGKGH